MRRSTISRPGARDLVTGRQDPAAEPRPAVTRESRFPRLREHYRHVAPMEITLRPLKAYGNWLRANYELVRGAREIRARPLKLTVDPTNVCQLRCPLCPTGVRMHDRGPARLSIPVFERLLDEVGDYLFLIDFFNWGEPLLNPHLEHLVSLAARRGIATFVSTNLSLPQSDDRIDSLLESGLSGLTVSLDGAGPETYGTYRRGGDFNLVVSNMRRLLARRAMRGATRPVVTWQFLVFAFNEHEVERARALAADIGVDRLVFRQPFLDPSRVELSEADRAAVASWKPSSTYERIEPPGRRHKRCGWHYTSTALNPDGGVAPCCTVFSKGDDFGVLGTGGPTYMQLVNGPRFQAVRHSFAHPGSLASGTVCDECPTPELMGYHLHLNRQVLLFAGVRIASLLARAFRFRQPSAEAPRGCRAT